MEEVEQAKEGKIEELEEQNIEFREEMKEEFATKMLDALKEMKEEIRAEVLSEVYESNPELQILEKIKELVAPTLNEEFLGNVFADELQTLREKNEELESERTLDEGAKKLAELIAPYGEKTQMTKTMTKTTKTMMMMMTKMKMKMKMMMRTRTKTKMMMMRPMKTQIKNMIGI